MSKPLKVRKIGSSLGLVLPKELLAKLNVSEGETLYPVETPNGIEMTPFDPDFVEVVEDSLDYMRRHRNAMRELAKG